MRFLIVLAVLLAGCFGHCGPTPTDAFWVDESLYAAMPVSSRPADGLETGLPEVRIAHIQFNSNEDRHGRHSLVRYNAGHMTAETFLEDMPGILADARTILENATNWDSEEIDEWLAEFEQSRSSEYEVTGRDQHGEWREMEVLQHPVELDGLHLLERLDYAGNGNTTYEEGPWWIQFKADTKTIELDGHTITVDAFGNAEADAFWLENESAVNVQTGIQNALRDANLPVPESVEVQFVVC